MPSTVQSSIPSFPRENTDDRTSRVADYVDDKLQTLADLEDLDALLSNVRQQHELLKQQLVSAESSLQETQSASQSGSDDLIHRGANLTARLGKLDQDLLTVTGSSVSDDAMQKFENSMGKLRQLDIADGYFRLLKDVDELSSQCPKELEKSHRSALDTFRRLQTLNAALGPLQVDAEGAAPHLLDHVADITSSVRGTIKETLAKELRSILSECGWPSKEAMVPNNLRDQFDESVRKLLDLQLPELGSEDGMSRSMAASMQRGKGKQAAVLLPIEVLAAPLELRFRYHFTTGRATDRIDQPQMFLSAVLDMLSTHETFVMEHVQPILSAYFGELSTKNNTLLKTYGDAISAFITTLLPMVRKKVNGMLPGIDKAPPQLLSHLVDELLTFDTALRDDWQYDEPGNGNANENGWCGLAWELLVLKGYFPKWLQIENDFALARYEEIVNTSGSFEIDYEGVDANATKPTKAAIRLHDLLENTTDRYSRLPSFSHRLRFLIDIQIQMLDLFHSRLHSSLEAYLSMTSGVLGRSVQGISREEQAHLMGLGGLDRLCRVYGSASFLEAAMRDWSDEPLFLDMYRTLQERVRGRAPSPSPLANDTNDNDEPNPTAETDAAMTSSNPAIAGTMTASDIAARTSTAVLAAADDDLAPSTAPQSPTASVFDETAGAYNRLCARTEGILTDAVLRNVREALTPYLRTAGASFASLSSSGAVSGPAHSPAGFDRNSPGSPDVQPVLAAIRSQLGFLARGLAPGPVRRIARRVVATVDTAMWSALVGWRISGGGAAVLMGDIGALAGTMEGRGAGGVAGTVLKGVSVELFLEGKSGEAARVLGVRVKGRGLMEGEKEEEERKGWKGEELGLWEVERRLFADNESARRVLEEMEIVKLSVAQARQALRCRVELGS
ncbi:hypothetical protein P152DRAFT_467669 [Eremomyces bilateralis CBS 781.70]|uniref:RINT-1 family protein n=1 Tax=Eremomyces bilateralis CBS 781.70 TaxID=1392243 RepID=A0A6G1FXZ3_9PEZI|nr:uncharacterized protein P152DRAFT_467669 [Eremomyces bilateralis CBS 781.70]KAF1810628.1 hypothetical protein P152DRAFT_467669 [Eremomyces bilateralis CBS 781.70]